MGLKKILGLVEILIGFSLVLSASFLENVKYIDIGKSSLLLYNKPL